MNYDLYPRQREVLPMLMGGSGLLWWMMRMGKTRAILHAFDELWQTGGPQVLVVVCPAIARGVWARENRETIDLPLTRLMGMAPGGVGDLAGGSYLGRPYPRILVIGWDTLNAWQETLRRTLRDTPYVLCFDEGHEHATNPRALRYQAARSLALLADRVWLTTGTPYKNNAMDIYHQLRLLGPRANPFQLWSPERFGKTFMEARWNPFAGAPTGGHYSSGKPIRAGGWDYIGLAPDAEQRLLKHLAGVVDRRYEEEGPERIRLPQWVDTGRAYQDGDGGMETARTALVPQKVKLTVQYVESLPWRPLVVVGWHREYLEQVAAKLGGKVIYGQTTHRDEILQDFQAGRIPVLCINIESAGVAIDLSRAHHMIFGELHWSEVAHRQAEARVLGPRQEQDHVGWHYLLVEHSVEEYVWTVKLGKGANIDRLEEAFA